MKPKVLMVSDVKGWGGWTRGEYIKKHLSDEFDFRLMDQNEFLHWEKNTNRNFFNQKDIAKFKEAVGPKFESDKDFWNYEELRKWVNNKNRKQRNYDIYYFLFHTMLIKKNVKRILKYTTEKKISKITVITGYPTVKECFYNRVKGEKEATKKFLDLANKCDAIGANNIKSLENLESIYNGLTFYVPRGIDPDIFYPENEIPRKGEFVAVYVGKPVPEKGLKEFIEPACESAGVKLIINDRNYTNALTPEEMRSFYNKANVYIVASTIDGTPNPALEAAACGLPIISNRIGNMPEFIKHGENGFLMDDRDVNLYIKYLKFLKENRRKCFEMGRNALNTVLNNWTWKKTTRYERNILWKIYNNSNKS